MRGKWRWRPAVAALLVTGVALSGCKTRLWELGQLPVETIRTPDMRPADMATPDLALAVRDFSMLVRLPVDLSPSNKIDLLVMMDNSRSMEPMQEELKLRFPQLLKPLADLAAAGVYADLHLGVVTSDYGAGSDGDNGCGASPGGQRGELQPGDPNCGQPAGANFLKYSFAPHGANNLPANQSLSDVFTCMASVGAMGCGYEHQLESVYAALHGNLPANKGFLRDDAVLAVLFLTNEDDGSAPPDTDIYQEFNQAYGYSDSYTRQTRFALQCGKPPAFPPYGSSNGPLDNCQPAPNWPTGMGPGKQFDVRRYLDLFTLPRAQGGLKDDPSRVLLFAIDGPEAPFQVVLSDPEQFPNGYPSCPKLNERSIPVCVPVLQHSCIGAQNKSFFADPSIRLNTVVRGAAYHGVSSICDNDYSSALASLSSVLVSRIGQGCVTFKLPVVAGDPVAECDVYDVDLANPAMRTAIPACTNNVFPCWRLVPRQGCATASPQGVGITVERNGLIQPIGTEVRAVCTAA